MMGKPSWLRDLQRAFWRWAGCTCPRNRLVLRGRQPDIFCDRCGKVWSIEAIRRHHRRSNAPRDR